MEWEREKWIEEYVQGESIAEIARRHDVSRKSLYKWIERYELDGVIGLQDCSRAPTHYPHAIEAIWQERIAAARQEHPRWGAPKLEWLLKKSYSDQVPSASTIGRILKQLGLSQRRTRKRARGTGPLSQADQCNEVWCVDFKGWRRTGDGQCCQPLTVTDHATRYLLCCQALTATRTELVKPVLERVFRHYGLPLRMRSDNGPPFGNTGACGLTELAAWLIELGTVCERIEPGRPQQNGRHERMHRTLGEITMAPVAATLRQQQKRFDEFRQEFNHDRPHQALGQQPPATLYQPSPRPWPRRTPEPAYGIDWKVRQVDGGRVKWTGVRVFISHALNGKHVAFEPVDDGLWRVWFYRHWLGEWNDRQKRLRRPHEFKSIEPELALSSPAGSPRA